MEFVLPETNAGLLPFAAAAVTVLFGLVALFAPRITLRALRLATVERHPEALSEARATIAGFYLGVGILTLLMFDQPFVQMALGAGWLFTAFGRLVSILSDHGSTVYNWLLLLLNLALAAMPLAPALGFVA